MLNAHLIYKFSTSNFIHSIKMLSPVKCLPLEISMGWQNGKRNMFAYRMK